MTTKNGNIATALFFAPTEGQCGTPTEREVTPDISSMLFFEPPQGPRRRGGPHRQVSDVFFRTAGGTCGTPTEKLAAQNIVAALFSAPPQGHSEPQLKGSMLKGLLPLYFSHPQKNMRDPD